MSGLKVEILRREFFYNGTRIPDPAPNLSVEQVRELLGVFPPPLSSLMEVVLQSAFSMWRCRIGKHHFV